MSKQDSTLSDKDIKMAEPCMQEGRIARIETLMETKLESISLNIDRLQLSVDNRLEKIEAKLNNGLSTAVQENTRFRRIEEERRKKEEESSNVERRRGAWSRLPLWQKIPIIIASVGFIFRPEIKDFLVAIIEHYIGK